MVIYLRGLHSNWKETFSPTWPNYPTMRQKKTVIAAQKKALTEIERYPTRLRGWVIPVDGIRDRFSSCPSRLRAINRSVDRYTSMSPVDWMDTTGHGDTFKQFLAVWGHKP